jgi:hypothetical protein
MKPTSLQRSTPSLAHQRTGEGRAALFARFAAAARIRSLILLTDNWKDNRATELLTIGN